LRSYHLARQLSAFLDVTYLSFRRDPSGGGALWARQASFEGLGDAAVKVWTVPRPPMYQASQLAGGLFGRLPVTLLNYRSALLDETLESLLGQAHFDFVHLESVHMAGYLDRIFSHANAPRAAVCDWHNVESELMSRYAARAGNIIRRLYALQTAPKIRRVERSVLRRCRAHLAVSERDRKLLLALEPAANVHVALNGVDVASYSEAELGAPSGPPSGPAGSCGARFRVLYVGSMDYHANIDAVDVFARAAWPGIHEAAPELVFTVAGRDPSQGLRERLGRVPGVEVTGTVPDVRPYYREAAVVVVPLRVGGGTRIKILEAMAAGVPVVSTLLGAEGLLVRPGEDFLPAETGEDFRDGVLRLWRDSRLARRLAESARELVRRQYDWSITGRALREVYTSLK
jgi:glycosyltransferase involved in cell wall biosynthesis